MAVAIKQERKYQSYMKACCVDFNCAGSFVGLIECLKEKDFDTMFEYIHENEG